MIRKTIDCICIFSLLVVLIAPISVQASSKTLRDYKNELTNLKNKQAENKRITNNTIAEINSKRNAIDQANSNIEANEAAVEESKIKIEESQQLIEQTTEELYDTLNYMQTIDGDKVYLEFMFNANSISDFIERSAIVDQITAYQNERINQLEVMIEDNYQLQENLNNQNSQLEIAISQYQTKIDELDKYLSTVTSIGLDYDEQIKAQEELIKTYQDAGCKDDDSIDYCFYSRMLNASMFIRPLESGQITQTYGNYGHNGIDISESGIKGKPVYASAPGVVVYSNRVSCGGNIVYIHHTVNGVAYTSVYGHLLTVNVKKGDTVQATTQIGTVGGDKSTWGYDYCTTGAHLHYSIAFGHYLGAGTSGYQSWNTFINKMNATADQSIIGIRNVYGWKFKGRY